MEFLNIYRFFLVFPYVIYFAKFKEEFLKGDVNNYPRFDSGLSPLVRLLLQQLTLIAGAERL